MGAHGRVSLPNDDAAVTYEKLQANRTVAVRVSILIVSYLEMQYERPSLLNVGLSSPKEADNMILRIILYVIVSWLVAAHFLRSGGVIFTALCLATPLLFLPRRRHPCCRRRRQRLGWRAAAWPGRAAALSWPVKSWRRPASVDHMPNRQHRMTPQHARTSPGHHLPDLLSHRGLVAMHRALGTGWLRLAEYAALQAPLSIVVQLGAGMAERSIDRSVMGAAMHAQHDGDGLEFARAPGETRTLPGIRFQSDDGHRCHVLLRLMRTRTGSGKA
jgi:hypothetical protein